MSSLPLCNLGIRSDDDDFSKRNSVVSYVSHGRRYRLPLRDCYIVLATVPYHGARNGIKRTASDKQPRLFDLSHGVIADARLLDPRPDHGSELGSKTISNSHRTATWSRLTFCRRS